VAALQALLSAPAKEQSGRDSSVEGASDLESSGVGALVWEGFLVPSRLVDESRLSKAVRQEVSVPRSFGLRDA
jgi:hypothetical protein